MMKSMAEAGTVDMAAPVTTVIVATAAKNNFRMILSLQTNPGET